MGATTTPPRVQRRQDLLDAAVRAVRREGAEVAMEDVAAEAGITRPILYRHFGDADGVYLAVAAWFGADLIGRFERAEARLRGSRRLLRAVVAEYVAFVAREPQIYRFLTRRVPTGSDPVLHFTRFLGGLTAGFLVAAGIERARATTVAHAMVGAIRGAGEWWMDEASVSRDRLVDDLVAFLWDGFSGVGGGRGR